MAIKNKTTLKEKITNTVKSNFDKQYRDYTEKEVELASKIVHDIIKNRIKLKIDKMIERNTAFTYNIGR